ncbi:MAG: pseudouridine synthase [Bacteroidetes bacterium]|nr:pseudouridine synthase [Bacteroidota bacterium]MDA0874234.1 pseudouridine synthase [Bacteroidota bacterium]
MEEPVRLNRYIASSGQCSRREADDLIARGHVKVNGKVVQELGTKVSHGDRVEVNGRQIAPSDREYLLLNKPKDTITTTSDEKGRRNVMDLLDPEEFGSAGLFPVGRLDRHTTGALLITNDGDLAHRLMHPSYGVNKQYVITTRDPISAEDLVRLGQGVQLDDGLAKADRVVASPDGDPRCVIMSIHEGRNRQVRRMIEALGNAVETLDRVLYAGLSTKGVRKGKWRRLTRSEVASLYRQVKL